MFRSSIFLTLLAGSLAAGLDITATTNLTELPVNSLFTKWRTTYHFTAPQGWLNDPCGAMYDPTRDVYHLMYQQWNPNDVQWGNISWGHAVSRDLVDWVDVGGWKGDAAAALVTGPEAYDSKGIFSGTGHAINLQGEVDGTLALLYTSVSALPTAWNIPYIPNTESQSFALSHDGGKTWGKHPGNPIIVDPPSGWNITGWRDPFYLPWPEMDKVLNKPEPHWYMVMGSGIRGVGPRIPFYSAPASNLTQWTFLGALWEPKDNETFGNVLETGSYGFNFEVSGFFSLKDEQGNDHFYATMGAEGGGVPGHGRWALWAEGEVSRCANGSAQFDPVAVGAADWGNAFLYAITSFDDTKKGRRVSWGWSQEDMNNYGVNAQGFQGAMGLPREVFVHKTYNVVADNQTATIPTNAKYSAPGPDGTYTVTSLGVKPLPDVVRRLRRRAEKKHEIEDKKYTCPEQLEGISSAHFELSATIRDAHVPVGFVVRASPGAEELTTITFDPARNLIAVDRSKSSLIQEFSNVTASGDYKPYTISTCEPDDNEVDTEVEDIQMNIFVDGSLVEVFVGGRFALTTRIYPVRDDALGVGIYVAEGAEAEVVDLKVWSGIGSVWPKRPVDTSNSTSTA
ncbi:Arabinanase/levansucrase/invertase [Choiromyces venosus 120613-1]|uniref:Arabinanase/levansucrase/invertase n=1 Tax=Choiromyces venosus 120613-1 TaxID=1336337 RepID=A0A3N4IZ94_9PEZI|nr:Arabinanase/levansucrase/invertase [Choiromyces venosus 120613-1]